MRRERTVHRQSRGRNGVILMIPLAMLTLFSIIGLTFVTYAETARPQLAQFRPTAEDLTRQTLQVTAIVAHDLRRALLEEVDFSESLAALDRLRDVNTALKADVRRAGEDEGDPEVREALVELCNRIEELLERIHVLRGMIVNLQFRE
jgi:hypothetical protein